MTSLNIKNDECTLEAIDLFNIIGIMNDEKLMIHIKEDKLSPDFLSLYNSYQPCSRSSLRLILPLAVIGANPLSQECGFFIIHYSLFSIHYSFSFTSKRI